MVSNTSFWYSVTKGVSLPLFGELSTIHFNWIQDLLFFLPSACQLSYTISSFAWFFCLEVNEFGSPPSSFLFLSPTEPYTLRFGRRVSEDFHGAFMLISIEDITKNTNQLVFLYRQKIRPRINLKRTQDILCLPRLEFFQDDRKTTEKLLSCAVIFAGLDRTRPHITEMENIMDYHFT